MKTAQLKNQARDFAKALLGGILGNRIRVHRIPFGPIRGRKIFLSPQISLRMWFGVDEPWIARLSRKLISPGDVVYDLGAHVGYTTVLFAAALRGSGAVHAFEILPSTADYLRKTVEANGFENVTIHNVGLGSEEAACDLPIGPTAMTSLLAKKEAGQSIQSCQVVRLEDYRRAKGLPAPTLIKMDIERAEIDCLRGSLDLINECRPKMIIAFHSKALLQQGYALLTSLEYDLNDERGPLDLASFDRIPEHFNDSILCLPRTGDG